MATLTGKTIASTYKDLLQVSNSNSGIDGTKRAVSDGEATASPLELSSAAVNISSGFELAGSAVTASATELNVMDGSATTQATVTLAGTDGVVISDGDTMKQALVSDFEVYMEANLDTFGATTVDSLSVSDGNITNVGDISLDSISSDAGTSINVVLGSDAGDDFIVDGTTLVVEGDTNRVGIGTASPDGILHIATSATTDTIQIERASNEDNGTLKFKTGTLGSSTDDWIVGERNDSTSNFRFYSYGTADDVLSLARDTGNVGIGTDNPDSKLEVSDGVVTITENSNGGISAITMRQTRGSVASPSNSNANGDGSYLIFQTYNSGYQSIAQIAGLSGSATDSGDLIFNTKPTGGAIAEAMRIDSAGDVTVSTGNLVIGTHGKGIDFSANTDDYGTPASGAEVLDDYEEGTFTPRIHDGTANSASTDINTGFYTKIGRHVHVQGQIRMTSKGSMTAGNTIRLDDFPFTLNTSTNCRTVCNIGTGNNFILTAGTYVNGYAGPSGTVAILRKWDTTDGSSTVLVSDLTDSTRFHFSMDYLTD